MSIQQIGSNQVPPGLGVPGRRLDALTSRGAPEIKGTSSSGEPMDRQFIAPHTAYFTRAMDIHTRDNAAAKTIRMSDEAMKAVGDTVDRMSSELDAIVKNYPPFPPGSEERISRLRTYAGLRDMIDRLTIPPEGDARTQMVGRKADDPTAVEDQWVLSIDPHGTTRTVPKESVPVGPTGLNIPRLDPPDGIDDLAIGDALEKLDAARRQVDTRRAELRAMALAGGSASREAEAAVQDAGATETSAVVREDLAGRPASIAFGGFAQLEQLLG
jgi:hypothetical protein